MYIGLNQLQQLFSTYSNLLIHPDSTFCLTGWQKISSEMHIFATHQLYVMEDKNALQSDQIQGPLHLLYIVNEDEDLNKIARQFPGTVSLLLIACNTPESIYQKLQSFFNTQYSISMFGQTLLEYLSRKDGLQSAVDQAFHVFHNPIFVIDINFHLIAATWDVMRQLHIQDDFILSKELDDKSFDLITKKNRIHDKIMKSDIPLRAYNDNLGYEQLYCAINPQKNLGHIVISAVNRPFEEIDLELLTVFKKFVALQINQDPFFHSAKGYDYEYFLKAILDQQLSRKNIYSPYTKSMIKKFTGNLYCLVFDLLQSKLAFGTTHVRDLIETRFPSAKSLIYHGQVIFILSFPENHFISSEYLEALKNLCQENDLYAGLSNCFQDIFQLRSYYQQALYTIELGIEQNDSARLFNYKDYYFTHIKKIFTSSESALNFCHPKMRLLLDYDAVHNSDLAYTFYMYLVHERNLSSTADAMFMHRSTLIYRFKKIQSLLNNDVFDDYKERMYMILSYEMIKK